ncbi:MAG TPA: HAMP domain-containing protein, partial [Polyangiaceae bacterium]|nr:HAMP domain-containing protein [Polyangiaceae bacterium]
MNKLALQAPLGRRPSHVTLGLKLVVSTVLVLSLVTAAVAYEVIARTRENLVAAKAVAAAMVGDLLAGALVAPLDFSDEEAIQAEVNVVAQNRALLCAAVWGANEAPVARVGRCSPAMLTLGNAATQDSEHASELRLVRPVLREEGQRLGTVALAFSLHEENAAFTKARRGILKLAGLVAASTALVLLGFARWQIVGPLQQLVQAAHRLGQGDNSARFKLKRTDEIGHLGDVFETMREAIVVREEKLAMATRSLRELFDHMRQGIVAFGPDGALESAGSKRARALFGERAAEGTPIDELLYGHDSASVQGEALRRWIEAAFACSHEEYADIAELAPDEVWLDRGADKRFVRLEFRPIFAAERLVRIMLLATDETELKQLETQVKSQDEEHARQMGAMRRLIAGGGQVFVRFIELSLERVTRCHELLQRATLTPADADEMMQHVHTLKGEARSFELDRLADLAMQLEDELSVARGRARSQPGLHASSFSGGWRSRLRQLEDALGDARAVFVAASPIGAAILDQVTVSRSAVQRLNELAGRQAGELGSITRLLAARPFGEVVAPLVDRVPGWADSLDKAARLEVEGKDILIPPDLARVLPGALVHIVRNAIAHGIETAGARVDAGKHKIGLIRARCIEARPWPLIVIEDDGRGIEFDVLAARAGLSGSDLAQTRQLIFEPRFSTATAVSELAGRGVGLSAVRTELATIGWTIDVDSTRRAGAAFVIRQASPEAT